MEFNQWLAYFIACWIISISPGAGAITSMSTGRQVGFKRGMWSILGLQLALILQIIIVAAGLGAVLVTSSLAFTAIKWFGVLYLLYLGLVQFLAKAKQELNADHSRTEISTTKLITRAFIVNISNPKAIVFFLAILPQFINTNNPLLIQYFLLTVTMVFVDVIVMMGYTGLAARILALLRTPKQQNILNKTFGSLFVAAAGFLATIHKNIN